MRSKSPELDEFYDTLCVVISRKKAWPDLYKHDIGNDACLACGSRHNWSAFHDIVTMFWDGVGDTNADWRRIAKAHGFDADNLHEVMLGVFIGGDKERVKRVTDNFKVHNIGFAKS